MAIYTDLACEARMLDPDLEGVIEKSEEKDGIRITRIEVRTEEAAKRLGKSKGRYVSLDLVSERETAAEPFAALIRAIEGELSPFVKSVGSIGPVLIAGLGNRAVTPDALGPLTAEKILVTRHVKRYLPDVLADPVVSTSVIAPGVLGSTGMETSELIGSLAERIGPKLVIAIDSLAARDALRLGASVQISDAGIEPGAGVGNLRAGINEKTVGAPVVAIGVPLVVYASTIVGGVLSRMAQISGEGAGEAPLIKLADEVMKGRIESMIVTPKDVDRLVSDMSSVLAEGINRALFRENYAELRRILS